MIRRQNPRDETAINEIREEINLLAKFEEDNRTEVGKRLVSLLEASISNTIKEFTTKEVEKFDTDAKMIFFLASCRSKLQTLMELKDMYVKAESRKNELKSEASIILEGG